MGFEVKGMEATIAKFQRPPSREGENWDGQVVGIPSCADTCVWRCACFIERKA